MCACVFSKPSTSRPSRAPLGRGSGRGLPACSLRATESSELERFCGKTVRKGKLQKLSSPQCPGVSVGAPSSRLGVFLGDSALPGLTHGPLGGKGHPLLGLKHPEGCLSGPPTSPAPGRLSEPFPPWSLAKRIHADKGAGRPASLLPLCPGAALCLIFQLSRDRPRLRDLEGENQPLG